VALAQQLGADAVEVGFQEPAGDLAQWRHPVFGSLAVVHPQQAFLQVHVGHGEIAQFLVADAGGVQHFQDGPVPVAQNRGVVHALNDALGPFTRPAPLTGRFAGLSASRLGTVMLAVMITKIREETLAATATLALFGPDAHGLGKDHQIQAWKSKTTHAEEQPKEMKEESFKRKKKEIQTGGINPFAFRH